MYSQGASYILYIFQTSYFSLTVCSFVPWRSDRILSRGYQTTYGWPKNTTANCISSSTTIVEQDVWQGKFKAESRAVWGFEVCEVCADIAEVIVVFWDATELLCFSERPESTGSSAECIKAFSGSQHWHRKVWLGDFVLSSFIKGSLFCFEQAEVQSTLWT